MGLLSPGWRSSRSTSHYNKHAQPFRALPGEAFMAYHTKSRWPPGVSDLSCYIICKVIVYRHGVRGLDQSAWLAPSCQFPHILHITPVTYPTTFSENKQKTLKNWLSNTLHRATESRPTWKNMEKAKIAPEIPPLAGQPRSHSRDRTQHRSFSLRTEAFKHSTSDNPAFKVYMWERGPPKYWLLKATGTCATRPTHLWQFEKILTCSCARTHPHGPSVEASDRGEPRLCVPETPPPGWSVGLKAGDLFNTHLWAHGDDVSRTAGRAGGYLCVLPSCQ